MKFGQWRGVEGVLSSLYREGADEKFCRSDMSASEGRRSTLSAQNDPPHESMKGR